MKKFITLIIFIVIAIGISHAQQKTPNKKSGTMKVRKTKVTEAEQKAKDVLKEKLKF